MKYNLPTREEAQRIVENSEAFYCTKHVIEGYNVEMYDYRLASISDYVDNNAFELRGLTFIEDSDGNWHRNILMNKFFNLNETSIPNLYEIVLDDGTISIIDENCIFTLKNGTFKTLHELNVNDDILTY